MEKCHKCEAELNDQVDRLCNACAAQPCVTCNGVIFDAVLAYCQMFLRNYAVNEVAKSVGSNFSEDDIVNARRVLQLKCADYIPDTHPIMKVRSRMNSGARSALQACASDITTAVYDMFQQENHPTFATLDISRLPLVRPVSGEGDHDERLLRLENCLRALEERLSSNEKLNEQKYDQSVSPTTRTYARITVPIPPAVPSTSGASASNLSSNSHESPNVASADKPLSDVPSNAEGWQLPREQVIAAKKRVRRIAGLKGKAQGTVIRSRAGGPNRDLWISNVDLSMEDDELKSFIEKGGSNSNGKVDIRLWEPRYSEGYDSKRFRLTIGLDDYERVYSEDFWPENIHIRKYWLSSEEKQALGIKSNTNNS